mmetsp:Transcript_976/g.2142  ORF Transcript_976/g.2142 Transcript_976/m.2142 type:complete len:297 (+) Transcript_976:570-1460(+)
MDRLLGPQVHEGLDSLLDDLARLDGVGGRDYGDRHLHAPHPVHRQVLQRVLLDGAVGVGYPHASVRDHLRLQDADRCHGPLHIAELDAVTNLEWSEQEDDQPCREVFEDCLGRERDCHARARQESIQSGCLVAHRADDDRDCDGERAPLDQPLKKEGSGFVDHEEVKHATLCCERQPVAEHPSPDDEKQRKHKFMSSFRLSKRQHRLESKSSLHVRPDHPPETSVGYCEDHGRYQKQKHSGNDLGQQPFRECSRLRGDLIRKLGVMRNFTGCDRRVIVCVGRGAVDVSRWPSRHIH